MTQTETFQGEECFARVERKYLIDASRCGDLIRLLNAELRPSAIESIYFDSDELDIFRSHYVPATGRYKLRTRSYSGSDFAFLELKMKERDETRKTRIRLDPIQRENLLGSAKRDPKAELGLALTRELVQLNGKLAFDELSRRVRAMDRHIRAWKLKPSVRIRYERRAFEDDTVRLTLDQKIRTDALFSNPRRRARLFQELPYLDAARAAVSEFDRLNGYVLEIKQKQAMPDWLTDFLDAHGIRQVRFSKYAYSVTKGLDALMLEEDLAS